MHDESEDRFESRSVRPSGRALIATLHDEPLPRTGSGCNTQCDRSTSAPHYF